MSRHPQQAVMRFTGLRFGPDGRESCALFECARDCELPMRWSHKFPSSRDGISVTAIETAGPLLPSSARVSRGVSGPTDRRSGDGCGSHCPGLRHDRQWFTVVGIVGDAKYRELRRSRLDLYISSAQSSYAVHQFVVRLSDQPGPGGRPDSIVGAIRVEVRAIDPALPIDDVVVLSDAVQSQIATPRLVALTFNGFAATAAALAALGLGTLIAWQVRLRTREIGVRLALGATPRQVIGIVMSESIPVVAGGVIAGLVTAVVLGRFLEALLFEVAPVRSAQRGRRGYGGWRHRAVDVLLHRQECRPRRPSRCLAQRVNPARTTSPDRTGPVGSAVESSRRSSDRCRSRSHRARECQQEGRPLCETPCRV